MIHFFSLSALSLLSPSRDRHVREPVALAYASRYARAPTPQRYVPSPPRSCRPSRVRLGAVVRWCGAMVPLGSCRNDICSRFLCASE